MAQHAEMNFCRRCGAKLNEISDAVYKCLNNHTLFANPAPSVGVFFITKDGCVLLSERGIEPHKGMLDAFGGFVDASDTSLEVAATRELREEIALEPEDYEPLRYLTSEIGEYPFEGEPLQVLSTLYWTRLTTERTLEPSDDVAAIRKIPLHEVQSSELHDNDIRVGIQRLQALFPSQGKEA